MTQDTNQTGPYDPRSPERQRHHPYRSQASADPAPGGSDESTHIWAEGIGLGGEDRDGHAASSRPTGYASAGQPTGQASPGRAAPTGQPQSYPDQTYPAQPYPDRPYPDQPYGGQAYGGAAFGQPGTADPYGQPYGQAPGPTDPYAGDSRQPSFLLPGGLVPDGDHGHPEDAAVPPGAPADTPFSALRDLTFTESATPRVTTYLYLLLVVIGVFSWIGSLVSGFSIGGAAGLTALVGGAVALAAWILLVRVVLEVALAVIRLGEDTRQIRERLAASDPADPEDEDAAAPGTTPEAAPGPPVPGSTGDVAP